MHRAYSILTVKAVDEESRVIEGIATTPSADRMGDVVEPKGAEFNLPIPLLWQHDHKQPIGHVESANVTKDGIKIKARIASIDEPGKLKDRLDEAWQSIKSGLVRGLSIGFRSLEDANLKDSFAVRYLRWEWLELSAVTIPANSQASILAIKSADEPHLLAALGHRETRSVRLNNIPGASGKSQSKGNDMETIKEQIDALQATRAAKAARMNALMEGSAKRGETLNSEEATEFDELQDTVELVDKDLTRLAKLEKLNVAKAAPVTPAAGKTESSAADVRSGIISVRPNIDKGTAFTRYVKALAMTRGNIHGALSVVENNKSWMDQTPEVAAVLKTAVAAGTTTDTTWAAPLFDYTTMASEFIELLRPQTILGKIQGLRRVPFNIRMASQTSGSSAYWVGQGKPTPVSKGAFTEVTLGLTKASGIVVLTEELVRSSSPAAEAVMRQDLLGSMAEFLDNQFIDPNYGGVTNVQPASITYGITPTVASGTTAAAARTDVNTVFGTFINNNLSPAGAYWIMTETTALALSMMVNSLGQKEFPDLNVMGGTWMGLPVVTSQTANISGSPTYGNLIILVKAPEILLADDGLVVVDASREASLEMDDAPTNDSATPTETTMVSMFQTNSVAIRSTRFINWKLRRTGAVAMISQASYVPQ